MFRDIDRYAKLFHWHTPQTICKTIDIKDPTTP